MKTTTVLLSFLVLVLLDSCSKKSQTEIHQGERNNVVNIGKEIKEIVIDSVLINRYPRVSLINEYLVVADMWSVDKLIHIFNKNNFSYITSALYKGQGPGEIANMGSLGTNESDNILYITDHGKRSIFSYALDSLLSNPLFYIPEVKMKMNESLFPSDYYYIQDTLCIGTIIEPTGDFGFKQSLAKWNMNTGEIRAMKYTHPEIERKRVHFDVSEEHNIYVESYDHHDLMTICRLDTEELIHNIYGKKWNNETSNKMAYYDDIYFCKNRIIASFIGGNNFTKDEKGQVKGTYPTRFLIFDLDGNYIKTLETGYRIIHFCYDKENNRIIMSLDDEIQFAYFSLDKIID